MRAPELVSVVAPMLDEQDCVETFYARVRDALGDVPWELVVVDDGSADGTGDALRALAGRDERVRVIELSRRFGHQAAITAGLDPPRGAAVGTIDRGPPDPPGGIPQPPAPPAPGAHRRSPPRPPRPGPTRSQPASAE